MDARSASSNRRLNFRANQMPLKYEQPALQQFCVEILVAGELDSNQFVPYSAHHRVLDDLFRPLPTYSFSFTSRVDVS